MKFRPVNRRLLFSVVGLLLLVVLVLIVRPWIGGYVIRTALGMAGATEIKFRPVTTVPSRVVVEDLEFRLESQVFSARRLSLDRPRWWRISLGKVKVEGARVVLTIDGSDTNPWAWSTYEGEAEPAEPMSLPVESLELEGEVTVRAALQANQRLRVKLEGAPKGRSDWVGSLLIDGPGFKLAGAGTLLGFGTELDFQVHSAELDLKVWQGFIQRKVLLPGGPWALEGKLTGVAEGQVTAKRFAATARVALREGRMRASKQDVAADGAEADLELSDLWKLRTKSGVLRLNELRVGRLPLRDVTADFGIWGEQLLTVKSAAFGVLGGRAEVAPFKYYFAQGEVATTLQVEGIDVPKLLELTTGVGADVSGRVSGSLPLRIQREGVRFDPGYLTLQPGLLAELECNATGLVRSGATIPEASMSVLKSVGAKPVRVRLSELRLDIRPPGIPLGTSALLHAAGETDDGPVTFDLNVNGAIERYLRILP